MMYVAEVARMSEMSGSSRVFAAMLLLHVVQHHLIAQADPHICVLDIYLASEMTWSWSLMRLSIV